MSASTSSPPSTAPAPVAAAGVDGRRALRRGRTVVVWVLLLVVGGAVLALAAGSPRPRTTCTPTAPASRAPRRSSRCCATRASTSTS
ncbi:hypothetical protein G7075_11005 [Phycicoccus sp. HDW14]|uniref:hypothetical protein n=1 Tax=Phycicoccus sp. HDW14 TaxID=2714941 RepID=UPI00140A564B|nr:hypothetical protein [Phycicoccus sp. HDW14]QIM21537.1 hypothetical protein G7075_11005 [Phycicoccus sp. HDW14]